MSTTISAVIIAKNAAAHIKRTVESAAFAAEVLLIDIKSQDDTVALAKAAGAKTIAYKSDSDFVEPVRNFALAQAKGDWILLLDADEEVPASLAVKLQELAANPPAKIAAFFLPRYNLIFGDWLAHTGWWPDYQLRFFKKDSVSWQEQIHSQPLLHGKPLSKQKQLVEFLPSVTALALIHHNYDNVGEYLARLNRYTDIEAGQQTADDQFQISSSSLLANFKDELFRRLFAKQGYLDGPRGFYLSLLQAIYQMTVQMKTWGRLGYAGQHQQFDQASLLRDLRQFEKELHYWIDDMEIKQATPAKKLWLQLKRKIGSLIK